MDPTGLFAILTVFTSGTLVLRPIAKALAGRIAGPPAFSADADRVRLLEAALHDTTLRLAAAENEIAQTAEKVEFVEKVLSGPASPPALV
jgi:hypothetical protein